MTFEEFENMKQSDKQEHFEYCNNEIDSIRKELEEIKAKLEKAKKFIYQSRSSGFSFGDSTKLIQELE